MRITFLAPGDNWSGGVRVIAEHARRLQERGHEVVVVSPGRRTPSLRYRVRRLVRGQWSPQGRGGGHLAELGISVRQPKRWRPITAADVPDADVVIATWWETAEWMMALPPAKGVKVHFLQGFETYRQRFAERVEAVWRLPVKRFAVSEWLRRIAAERFADTDVKLVPNGVDLAAFSAEPRLRQAPRTVGYLQSGLDMKGCDIAADACRLARLRIPELRVVSFGTSLRGPRLPAGAEFHHRPAQSLIPSLYASCDAWLFASRAEGFGLPILEAMACRTPVIGTPAGASPELLAGGGGRLVAPEDPQAMADAICDLLAGPESTWREMSERARATAEEHSWDRVALKFEDALKRAVEEEREPSQARLSILAPATARAE